MIVRDRSFPHPVLSPFRDDVMPNLFELSVTVSSDADNHYLDIRFMHENRTLGELIGTGRATHAVHIECRRNFYREMFRVAPEPVRLSLGATDVVGRVDVSGFIVATEPLDGYRIDGSHADYGATAFAVQAGDVLAVSQSLRFDAFVDYDPLASIASILTIEKSPTSDEGPIVVNADSDRIVAILSRQDYARYTDLKPDRAIAPLLANQVFVPVLVEAIGRMKGVPEEEHEESMNLRWYRSVVRKLQEHGMDIRSGTVSSMEAAQALLGLPLRRSLEGLQRLTTEDVEA